MSIGSLILDQYTNYRASAKTSTVGELYGTESFRHFLYSLVRMDRPSVVVELGCGGAATALMVSKALHENHDHGGLTINLTETKHGKRNKMQNSRALIKIQPVDYLPHNDVVSFGSTTSPWEME